MPIVIPLGCHELRSDAAGFRVLSDLHRALQEHSDEEIHIDCSKLNWLDAHLSAPLMTVIFHSKQAGNDHKMYNLSERVRQILRKNNTLKTKEEDVYHTTMPVTHFALHKEVEFAQYTRSNIARPEMPKMSDALRSKFYEGIDELFANCSLHSRSAVNVSVCGQFFPRTEKLSFTISDGGIGIAGSLKQAGFEFDSVTDAIDWAMQPNNTSRQGDIPGGLGLRLLRDFVEANQGKLTVASTRGLWIQSGRNVVVDTLRRPFPGTAVILEINTADKKRYDLKTVTDPRNIW